ncbi:MAG: lipoyl protein ligase domain-containing protein [Acidimicrobiales bacterium]
MERATGSAAEFHARDLPDDGRRRVWVWRVASSALVLGSAQPEAHVNRAAAAAAGVEVVRRRSGGSAVLLEPGGAVWVDVVLPAGDPLWDDDVGRAPRWLGRAWARALGELGLPDAVVHPGPHTRGGWADYVCFAGLASGEVLVGGRKVVGVAQRRTRRAVRFQSAALLSWRPAELVALLHPPALPAAELAPCAAGLGELLGAVEPGEVEEALVSALLATPVPTPD